MVWLISFLHRQGQLHSIMSEWERHPCRKRWHSMALDNINRCDRNNHTANNIMPGSPKPCTWQSRVEGMYTDKHTHSLLRPCWRCFLTCTHTWMHVTSQIVWVNHFRTTFLIHSCFRLNLKWDSDKNFPQSLEKASGKLFTPTGKIYSFFIKAYSTVITAIPMPVWKNKMVLEEVQSILMSSHFPSTLGNIYSTICQASDHLLSEGGSVREMYLLLTRPDNWE